ncbi:hypothetical protein JZ751_013245 [Albula glossodonta]|uniref:Uncharacterized protein n=1 Tax=Albula glossodonta TaxID=121402 RepID=A0A8T2NXK7_9TELE|nr:hypothetical protein JZ751_013245 [Albula glossodonta]
MQRREYRKPPPPPLHPCMCREMYVDVRLENSLIVSSTPLRTGLPHSPRASSIFRFLIIIYVTLCVQKLHSCTEVIAAKTNAFAFNITLQHFTNLRGFKPNLALTQCPPNVLRAKGYPQLFKSTAKDAPFVTANFHWPSRKSLKQKQKKERHKAEEQSILCNFNATDDSLFILFDFFGENYLKSESPSVTLSLLVRVTLSQPQSVSQSHPQSVSVTLSQPQPVSLSHPHSASVCSSESPSVSLNLLVSVTLSQPQTVSQSHPQSASVILSLLVRVTLSQPQSVSQSHPQSVSVTLSQPQPVSLSHPHSASVCSSESPSVSLNLLVSVTLSQPQSVSQSHPQSASVILSLLVRVTLSQPQSVSQSHPQKRRERKRMGKRSEDAHLMLFYIDKMEL